MFCFSECFVDANKTSIISAVDDIAVAYEDMPCTIKAFTKHNSDDSYTIVLNERLTYEQHLISYQHELQHILNGDYDKDISADAIEAEAHRL